MVFKVVNSEYRYKISIVVQKVIRVVEYKGMYVEYELGIRQRQS